MALEVEVLPDADAVAERGAQIVASAAALAVANRGRFTLAVSGGRTPWAMFAALYGRMPWDKVTIFQVDERIAPEDDPDRNLTQLQRSLPPGGAADVRPMPVWAEDLEAVLRGDRHEPLEIGRPARRRRERAGPGRLGERAHEVLEAGGLGHEQEACLGRADHERMGDVAGPVDEGTRGRLDHPAADPERELALDDVEPLVFAPVDVQRRAGALRREMLDDGDAAVGRLARRLDRREDAEEPERLALIRAQCDRLDGGGFCGAHAFSLPIGET